MKKRVKLVCPRCKYNFTIEVKDRLHPMFKHGEVEDAEFEVVEVSDKLIEEKKEKKVPYCTNSRRWLDFELYGAPKSCPYRGFQGAVDCIGDQCGYYELKEPNYYYKKKREALQSYAKFE